MNQCQIETQKALVNRKLQETHLALVNRKSTETHHESVNQNGLRNPVRISEP